ncbi:hypothetical protein FOZ63_028401, partial [Perkinsus olseni]
STAMVHHCVASIGLWILYGTSVFAIRDLKSTFEDLNIQKGLVYTPDEEAQHLARFEEELKGQAEFISTEDVADLFDETRPAIMQSFVDEINSKQKTWTASIEQGRLKTFSLGDTKRLCGTLREAASGLTKKVYAPEELQDLPADFDARSGFPKCSGVIGHIRDQSACGSCWAFGSTEAFNDRLCIKSDGNFTALLSAGEMNACAPSLGCKGGYPVRAWRWLHDAGIATGGDYVEREMTKADGCWPYDFPPCAHYEKSTKYVACQEARYSTPVCVQQCHNARASSDANRATPEECMIGFRDRHFMVESSPYQYSSVDDAKKAIATDGPVSAIIVIYEDFLAYKSGVYYKKNATEFGIGLHAVKIIGWGEENGEDYWLVANSWNEDWGDRGLCKIAFGQCGIEDQLLGGTPKV